VGHCLPGFDSSLLIGVQKYDPAFVDYDRPLTPPKVFVAPYPKKVTEDDVRNNPPKVLKNPLSQVT
jgi:hypothetical protein